MLISCGSVADYGGNVQLPSGVTYFVNQRAYRFVDHVPFPLTMHNGQKIITCLGTKVGSTR